MKVTFLGHACFLLEDSGKSILTDPFLSGNPQAAARPGEVSPDYILVSHAHQDHLGDTIDIAKRTGAIIISTAEVAGMCSKEGVTTHAMHIGGKRQFDFGFVRIAPAFHGAGVPGGHACGFVFSLGGKTAYFAGDTGIFGDMELLGRLEPLDLAILPIGGNYTMDADDAVVAVTMLEPKVAVPMHYSTWPLIKADPLEWKKKVEAACPRTEVMVVGPGQSIEI